MRSRIIGGEFELTSLPCEGLWNDTLYNYASGRVALYQILKSIKLTTFKVWLPEWLCGSMIDAVRRAGLFYKFYPLGPDLKMDVRSFVDQNKPISENDVIVMVNYFGMVDIERTIEQLRSLKVESVIIEDDVQALFSFLDEKPHAANYRFTSLRKTIACPDGGPVKTNRQMPIVNGRNTFAAYKLKGAILKGAAEDCSQDDAYLTLFEKGEKLIENNYDSAMSYESACILARTDLEEVATKRRTNALYLVNGLRSLGIEPILPIKENQVPLFVPILIDNRDEVRAELRRNGIFCPVHWPLREDMSHLPLCNTMAARELSLVIDQRYNLEDMQCIIQVLKDAIWK